VLQRARAAIVCSGTATLEAALCACPHVVVYKVSKLVEAQARLVRFRVRHIAQPNILLERDVVPELIQYDATPKRIQEETRRLLQEESARIKQLQAFRELKALLGPDDALDRTADLIAGFLRPAG
jgi:lipid-A-disaccharide synthase